MSLNCLLCDGELEDAFAETQYNQPSGGTAFTSRGHYGSTVWDPMPGWGGPDVWLEINICDLCLARKADDGVILVVKPVTKRTEYETRPWTGPKDLADRNSHA